MGWESFDIKPDFGTLIQGQIKVVKLKVPIYLLSEVLGVRAVLSSSRKSGDRTAFVWLDLNLGLLHSRLARG